MKTMTRAELIAYLGTIRGATFATIVADTDPKLRKTGNTLGNVRKHARVNVTLGFNYEAAVNRQRTREGSVADFEAADRAWGQADGAMVRKGDKTYLRAKIERSLSHRYVGPDGIEIPEETVKPFLPVRKESTRQDTEKEIRERDYMIENIRHITVKGEEFLIVG